MAGKKLQARINELKKQTVKVVLGTSEKIDVLNKVLAARFGFSDEKESEIIKSLNKKYGESFVKAALEEPVHPNRNNNIHAIKVLLAEEKIKNRI